MTVSVVYYLSGGLQFPKQKFNERKPTAENLELPARCKNILYLVVSSRRLDFDGYNWTYFAVAFLIHDSCRRIGKKPENYVV